MIGRRGGNNEILQTYANNSVKTIRTESGDKFHTLTNPMCDSIDSNKVMVLLTHIKRHIWNRKICNNTQQHPVRQHPMNSQEA